MEEPLSIETDRAIAVDLALQMQAVKGQQPAIRIDHLWDSG